MLIITKLIHNDKVHIAFKPPVSFSNKQLIKKHSAIKYTKTHKCWYIPKTKVAYDEFLLMEIPFKFDESVSTSKANRSSDHNTILSNKDKYSSVSSVIAHSEDVNVVDHLSGLKSIQFNSLKFVIDVDYNQADIGFLKGLKRSYWNANAQRWIVQGSILNLEELQSYFMCFSNETFGVIYEQIKQATEPQIVDMFYSPQYSDSFFVELKGHQIDVSFIMSISKRNYSKENKTWKLPFSIELVDRIVEHYTNFGAKVINRISKRKPNPRKTKNLNFLKELTSNLKEDECILVEQISQVMMRSNYSWSSIKSYTGKILRYYQYLSNLPMGERTSEHANQYLTYLTQKDASESLLNAVVSSIKFYYTKVLYLPSFDLQRILRPKKSKTLPKFLSKNEIDLLLRSASNLKHQTLLCTLYSTGIRLAELLNIQLSDIYWDRNQILIQSGKGKKDRMVTLSQVLKQFLEYYIMEYRPSIYLFEGMKERNAYTASSVQKVVRTAALKAGIRRRVTPHMLRHSYATHLMDGGVDTRFIKELLGHKDIKTTLVYTHVTTNSIQNIKSPLDQLWINKSEK